MEKKLPKRLTEEVAAFAVSRPLRLMFQDEARFGRISDVRHCWDKKPHRPMVRAMLTQQYTYAYGAVSPLDGRFDSLILPWVNGDCMQLFVDEIAARYPHENIISRPCKIHLTVAVALYKSKHREYMVVLGGSG